jgi:hypothetical protein
MCLEVYEVDAGQRLRFALGKSKEEHHGVFWLQVAEDGSVYFNLIKKPKSDIAFSKVYLNNVNTTIPYNRKRDLVEKDKDKLNQHKFSFHASGTVHSIERTFGTNLRILDKRITLCDMIFNNIKKFPKMNDKKKYQNFVFNYNFEVGYPISCKIIVEPFINVDEIKEVILNVRYQFSKIFIYPNLKDIQPLIFQIIFYHNSKAPNPPYDTIMWIASDYKTKETETHKINN